MIWRIPPWRCFLFIPLPCCPAEAKPMLTTSPVTIAAATNVVVTSLTTRTVEVEIVFNVLFVAFPACYLGLGVERGGNGRLSRVW